ncbi:hypothetical protein DL95DRAFT_396062 [Leptodontidium sp. 2 PMI_412]|nr:hypothetical protein DL95DRAFT_396062 [Leptodontidium sp. 2 PMI_412]
MGFITPAARNPMAIRVLLDPNSSAYIRSLINKYRQVEYGQPRHHEAKPPPLSTWSHMMLLRVPPIDPSVYNQAASKLSRLYNPFDVVFSRPYRALSKRGNYVALEYWSYELSEVVKHLQKDLFSQAQEYADHATAHLATKKARSRRLQIMRGLDDDTPHVTLASRLSEEDSEKVLTDLKSSFLEHGNTSSFTVRAVALELAQYNDPGQVPQFVKLEEFPFGVQKSVEVESQLENVE